MAVLSFTCAEVGTFDFSILILDRPYRNHYIMITCCGLVQEELQMKVVFDISAGRLSIEGDGPDLIKVLETARELAPAISQIQLITGSKGPLQPTTEKEQGTNAYSIERTGSTPQVTGTLRQFVRSLALDNISERIAAISYYVNKIEQRPSFSPKEMDGWFTMCGFQKPAQMPLALFDAKRKYGFSESAARGIWRISNQGENMIIRKIEEAREAH
jgi:hypothetical protein